MRIYLIGYMGSGKSTLGQDLAKVLGLSWIDLDDEFELQYKISISRFFEKYGENVFRELEHKLLREFSSFPDIIISTGGGTPCFYGNMDLMNKTGLTIYLNATPELILSRIKSIAWKRPVFQKMEGNNPLHKIQQHLKTREMFYEQAKITFDATNPDIQEMKDQILKYFAFTGE